MQSRIYGLFVFAILAALSVVVCTAYSVRAAVVIDPFYQSNDQVRELVGQIDEKKKKIDSLTAASKEYAQKIEDAEKQTKTLQNHLASLENLLTKIQLDIQANQLRIDKTVLEISVLEYDIQKREQEIAANKDRIIEYIRLIYKNDRRTVLELLILNDSFSEFFSQLNYAEEIQSDLRKSVEQLQLLKDTLETNRGILLAKRDELERAQKELEDNQQKYMEDQEAKAILLAQTKSNETRYQALLVQTRQLQNAIDSDILSIEEELRRRLERLRSGSTATSAKNVLIGWPVDKSRGISAYFRDASYPYRHLFEHPAVDIRAPQGTSISAPADGIVARAVDAGYGYSYIILIHEFGLSTVYGHVSKIMVKEDQYVKAGQTIGLSGGRPGTPGAGNLTTGPHLHFETRLNGLPVNPLDYLP